MKNEVQWLSGSLTPMNNFIWFFSSLFPMLYSFQWHRFYFFSLTQRYSFNALFFLWLRMVATPIIIILFGFFYIFPHQSLQLSAASLPSLLVEYIQHIDFSWGASILQPLIRTACLKRWLGAVDGDWWATTPSQ